MVNETNTAEELTNSLGQGMFNNTQLVNYLTNLDSSLNAFSNTPGLTENTQNQINDILTLNDEIIDMYNNNQNSNIETQNKFLRMQAQLTAGNRLVNELSTKTYQNINDVANKELKTEISNKRRMTEINNYYSNMNTYINNILKNLVIVVAIIILFTILSKKGVIPSNITTIINIILILLVIIYIVYSVYDINIRDKFNFDEYVIPFDQKTKTLELSGNAVNDNSSRLTDIRKNLSKELLGGVNSLENILGTCVGSDCCDTGTIYDYKTSTCIRQCPSGETYQKSINPETGKLESKCV